MLTALENGKELEVFYACYMVRTQHLAKFIN